MTALTSDAFPCQPHLVQTPHLPPHATTITMAPPTEVDVIILGGASPLLVCAVLDLTAATNPGGAAGCVVAGRLAKADPSLSIAIIEAGIDNKDLATSFMPAMFISHLAPTSTTAK